MYSKRQLRFRDPLVTNKSRLTLEEGETIETMMFPFMFPQLKQFYVGKKNYVEDKKLQIEILQNMWGRDYNNSSVLSLFLNQIYYLFIN